MRGHGVDGDPRRASHLEIANNGVHIGVDRPTGNGGQGARASAWMKGPFMRGSISIDSGSSSCSWGSQSVAGGASGPSLSKKGVFKGFLLLLKMRIHGVPRWALAVLQDDGVAIARATQPVPLFHGTLSSAL